MERPRCRGLFFEVRNVKLGLHSQRVADADIREGGTVSGDVEKPTDEGDSSKTTHLSLLDQR